MHNELEQWLMKKAAVSGRPVQATLELTPICNMNCNMCYIRHSRQETEALGGIKSPEFWKRLIDQMKQAGILFISLIGGEVFTYPSVQEIYTYLTENGFYVNLTTNGTFFTEEIPWYLLAHRPRYVSVSLYGMNDDTYEKVTGMKQGFIRTIRGIQNLVREKIELKLNFCITKENVKEIDAFFALASQYQAAALASAYCFPSIRKPVTMVPERLSPEMAAEADLLIKKHEKPELFYKYLQYLATRNYKEHTSKHTDRFYCKAGTNSFWVTWKGLMTPCGMLEAPGIDLSIFSIEDAWEILKKAVNSIKLCPDCSACKNREICSVCPASMFAETGCYDGRPDYFCCITEEKIHLAEKFCTEMNLSLADNSDRMKEYFFESD